MDAPLRFLDLSTEQTMHDEQYHDDQSERLGGLNEDRRTTLQRQFQSVFNRSFNGHIFHCPGRINLIGEHVDYNGGHVLPSALEMGIFALVEPHDRPEVRFRSTEFPDQTVCPLDPDGSRVTKPGEWGAYPEGVVRALAETHDLSGSDVLFHSNLPVGSGLSSSAALEVLTGFLLLDRVGVEPDRACLAHLCHRVENEFIGVDCGIMDQFAVALARRGHALLLDCSSVNYRHVPTTFEDHRLVVMNTNNERSLADSAYNERRAACEEALDVLRINHDYTHLCEASLAEVNLEIDDEELRKRARHVVTEERRVQEAVNALSNGQLQTFGQLMTASHDSLRDNYEVTGPELDAMVDAARAQDACAGARMTGAGFGGCAIALVDRDTTDYFIEQVEQEYHSSTGIYPDFYVSVSGDGVRRIH